MNTVQVGLLIKDAGRHEWKNRTVIVTANGQVTFAYGQDHNTGMQFTIDQWNEIVQFVGAQVKPKEDKASWDIDWSEIDCKYNYVAVDMNGIVFAFRHEPELRKSDGVWGGGPSNKRGDFKPIYPNVPVGLDWTQSLIKRPIHSPKHVNCPCHTS